MVCLNFGTKTKSILLLVFVAIAFVAGTLASVAIVDADGDGGKGNVSEERDNLFITGITAGNGQLIVLVDNAGIGGTSSVELTCRFPSECALVRVDGTAPNLALTVLADGGELGGDPHHTDQKNVAAIVLKGNGGTCTLDPSAGEYISISTVGSTKKG